MAGLVTTPIQPYNLNATPTTGAFFTTTPSSWGYDNGTTVTAWTAGSTNVVLVPNSSGNTFLWYYCGATPAGVAQVLVGQVLAGQALPATTAQTIAATSSGWLGPFSPAVYNIGNVNVVPTGIAGSPTISTWPNAALGCYAVAFTTTTTLLVRAYTFSNVQP